MDNGCKGLDAFIAVNIVVSEYGGFDKLSCVVTDGAPAMTGKNEGFVGQLKENYNKFKTIHCIIHQEVLCSKK